MTIDAEQIREDFLGRLRAMKPPPTKLNLQSYLGSPAPVLGLSVPQIRTILGSFRKSHRKVTVAEVNRIAAALWHGKTYEEKSLAIGLLDLHARILDDRSWRLASRWVDAATGWALSDSLASGPIAKMVREKSVRYREALRWTDSDHLWRRRASTYAMHDFVLAGELEKPFRLLERLLGDAEFWVQRAVGTWLRECWKQDPRATTAFLRKHVSGMPRVVITVATERAPKSLREELRRNRGAVVARTASL
jgi:3-methyladenine DNA glycosylase AlkD